MLINWSYCNTATVTNNCHILFECSSNLVMTWSSMGHRATGCRHCTCCWGPPGRPRHRTPGIPQWSARWCPSHLSVCQPGWPSGCLAGACYPPRTCSRMSVCWGCWSEEFFCCLIMMTLDRSKLIFLIRHLPSAQNHPLILIGWRWSASHPLFWKLHFLPEV